MATPSSSPTYRPAACSPELTQQPAALVLQGHHRQQHAWERQALQALRQADISTALDAYRAHGRLHTSSDQQAVQADAVVTYLDARSRQPDPWQTVLLAHNREDVRRLNDQVRDRLLARGELGKQALQVDTQAGPVDYRVGDQVLVTRNDHARGLLNGTPATVTQLDADGLTLVTTGGQQAEVGRAWLAAGQLDHGYAMTLHKAQGRTVHTALVVGNDTLSTQAGYVGLSRGTYANHLFLSSPDLHDLSTDCSSRVQHRRPAREQDRHPLSRDSRQQLAGDQRIANLAR